MIGPIKNGGNPYQHHSIKKKGETQKKDTPLPLGESKQTQFDLSAKIKHELMHLQPEESRMMRAFLTATYHGKKALPPPCLKHAGQAHESAILWRGCTAKQLVSMARSGSAGGKTANPKTAAPTEHDVRMQVGEKQKLPEFTAHTAVAESFGTAHFVVAVEIETRYLNTGSTAEKGFICHDEAPLKILAWKEGRSTNSLKK